LHKGTGARPRYDRKVDSIPPLGEARALAVTSGSVRSPPVPMMSGDELLGTCAFESQLDQIQPRGGVHLSGIYLVYLSRPQTPWPSWWELSLILVHVDEDIGVRDPIFV